MLISSNIGLLQVKFVFEIFKKLRPGIPLKCMDGKMDYVVQQAIVADFNESTSVLFSTDITSRGLDIKNVDWVVQVCHYVKHYHFSCTYSHAVTFLSHLQVDCPENILITSTELAVQLATIRKENRLYFFVLKKKQCLKN